MPNIYRVFYGDSYYQYNNFRGDCCRFLVEDGTVMIEKISKKQYDEDYKKAIEDNSLAY